MNIKKIITLKEGEKVLKVVREYPFTYIVRGTLAVILIYLPFFFMVPLFEAGKPGKVVFVSVILLGTVYIAKLFLMWYWNAFVVTTYRVVDIDQRGFFDSVISEAMYDKIEDISYRRKGVFGALFGYGTVGIKMAGNSVHLELHNTKNPKEVHHLITDAMGEYSVRSSGASAPGKIGALLEMISELSGTEARAAITALLNAEKTAKEEKDKVNELFDVDDEEEEDDDELEEDEEWEDDDEEEEDND